MIPNELEKLVLCGKAVAKSISLGRSGQMVIPVTDEATVIIYHYDYFHFIDFTVADDMEQALNRSVHQLIFKSGKTVAQYIIKEDLQISMRLIGVNEVNQANVTGVYQKNVYQVHDEDIIVTISVAPEAVGTFSLLGTGVAGMKSEEPPLGYGTAPATAIAQTVNEVFSGLTGNNLAQSRKFGTIAVPTPQPNSSLRYPVIAVTALLPTNVISSQGQRSYPLLNVDYVEIKKNVAATLFSGNA